MGVFAQSLDIGHRGDKVNLLILDIDFYFSLSASAQVSLLL